MALSHLGPMWFLLNSSFTPSPQPVTQPSSLVLRPDPAFLQAFTLADASAWGPLPPGSRWDDTSSSSSLKSHLL